MSMQALKRGVHFAAGIAGAATLLLAIIGLTKAALKPKSLRSDSVSPFQSWLLFLVGAAGYLAVCVWLWIPIPLRLVAPGRLLLIVVGVPVYLSGLILSLGAMQAPGAAYRPSSVFGAEASEDQGLIMDGPYAYVRHPMYLAAFMTAVGGLLVFKTWTMVFLALSCLPLVLRARRKEQALERAYGEAWLSYRRHVPAWIPRSPVWRKRER